MEDHSRISSVASIKSVVSFNKQQKWIKHIAPSFADQRWSSATLHASGDDFPRESKGNEPESVPVLTKRLDDVILSEKEAKKPVSESSGPPKGPPSGMEGLPGKPRGPQDPNIVNWDSLTDPDNPLNFGKYYKMWITFQLAMLAFTASLGSSIIVSADADIMQYMGVGRQVVVLGISLYIAGFGFGPILWAPISELYGRRWSMLPPTFCMGCFAIGSAVSRNPQTYFITRFFAGLFGSAPVVNVSAALSDIYLPQQRGMAITFYSIAVVGGPTLGPMIGATFVVSPGLGWRWTEYISAIWTFAVLIVACNCLPETYTPVLLQRKAIRARKVTGNQDLYHPNERINPTFKELFTKHFSRPLKMLFTEPIVTVISVYAAFVYSILYLTIVAFPIVFRETQDWGIVVSTLPFLGLFVGVVAATGINIANQPRYARLVKEAKGKPVPEGRLAPMAYGAVLFAVGLWWFGWTVGGNIHWISPVLASFFIGAGFIVIFQQCINFLVDTYLMFAASSIAASTILRSIIACGFPLAAAPMFSTLGVGPAISILSGIATLGIPIPFIFMKYAKKLRGMSKFAPEFGPGERPGGYLEEW